MRVLHAFTVAVTRNGITMFALQRLEGLRKAGVEVDLLSPTAVEPGLRREIEHLGARLFVIQKRRLSLAYVRALAALVRRERYDIVHAHGSSSSLFFEMLGAGLGGCRARVAHSHNTTCGDLRRDRLLRPLFYRSYTAAAACGRDAGKWLFGGRPFTVLPNGVDLARFQFDAERRAATRARLGIAENALVLGHVGRFNRQKNHGFLLEVFAALLQKRPDARLMLVGDGYQEEEVRRLAAPLGARVIFTGSVPDPETYLCAMDVMALPSPLRGLSHGAARVAVRGPAGAGELARHRRGGADAAFAVSAAGGGRGGVGRGAARPAAPGAGAGVARGGRDAQGRRLRAGGRRGAAGALLPEPFARAAEMSGGNDGIRKDG